MDLISSELALVTAGLISSQLGLVTADLILSQLCLVSADLILSELGLGPATADLILSEFGSCHRGRDFIWVWSCRRGHNVISVGPRHCRPDFI